MQKVVIIVVALAILAGGIIGFGMMGGTKSITDAVTGGGACQSEFDVVYNRHQADLSDCSLDIRDGEFAGNQPVPKQNNVVLIFDSSGSMAGESNGEPKIEAAKAAVAGFVSELEGTNTNVSVVVYGHTGDNTEANKARSCAGIDELYSFGEASGARIERTLDTFEPTGWTPIADSLEEAYAILAPYNSDAHNNSIVLISDGIETCGGDPVAVVAAMQDRGLEVKANVIGFDVTESESVELREIADIGGGEYFNARSRADIQFALDSHRAYMEEFDYRMRRVSENLEDINAATERHFACVRALEEERANVILDMYVDGRVSESCHARVDQEYTEIYEAKKAGLERSFEAIIADFQSSRN